MVNNIRTKISEIETKFSITHTLNDPIFGDISILQNESDENLIMIKENNIDNPESAEADIEQAKERISLNYPYILKMLDYSVHNISENNYCVKGFYKFPEINLLMLMQEKIELKESFDSDELTTILIHMLKAIAYLQVNKMVHGDIRPEYIGFYADEGSFILSDRLGNPAAPNIIQINNIGNNNTLYLSPV